MRIALLLCLVVTTAAVSAERQWQTGTWADVGIKRKVIDFGPGASGFGRPGSAPEMRAMADVHTYVIEAGNLRFEIEDVVQVGRPSVEAVPGGAVTFAVDRKTVYVRDAGGAEHRLRLTKKTAKSKS
jgi:hypothetical protein